MRHRTYGGVRGSARKGSLYSIVIGNYKLWSSKPHFQDLATVIPLTKITNEISHIAEKEEA